MTDRTAIIDRATALFEDLRFGSAREWKAAAPGRRVVGYMPIYVPRELIHAAGMLPLGIVGGMLQRHHPVHRAPQLPGDLRQTDLRHGSIAAPLLGQPGMGVIDRLLAALDRHIGHGFRTGKSFGV